MIYILSGNDTKKKSACLKKLYKSDQPVFVPEANATKEMLLGYAMERSLFGESMTVVFENILKKEDISLSPDELSKLKDSKTVVVFLEEKLLAIDSKKYIKYATIEDFSTQIVKQAPKMNMFSIADAFARRDKINTWILYRDAVALGAQPEEISGIIFWKIKNMVLNGTKSFSQDELKNQSSELVSLYHKAHRGESDFVIGLEQFILSTLSK
jgi:DNA polymerase III delta subunit